MLYRSAARRGINNKITLNLCRTALYRNIPGTSNSNSKLIDPEMSEGAVVKQSEKGLSYFHLSALHQKRRVAPQTTGASIWHSSRAPRAENVRTPVETQRLFNTTRLL